MDKNELKILIRFLKENDFYNVEELKKFSKTNREVCEYFENISWYDFDMFFKKELEFILVLKNYLTSVGRKIDNPQFINLIFIRLSYSLYLPSNILSFNSDNSILYGKIKKILLDEEFNKDFLQF